MNLLGRVPKAFCFLPLKRSKGLLVLSTPRPQDSKKTLLTSAREATSSREERKGNGTRQKPKASSGTNTTARRRGPPDSSANSGVKSGNGKTPGGSPLLQSARILSLRHEGNGRPEPQFVKRAGSDSAFQLTDEMREILGLTERRADIPYSINRFHGRYQEVVPPKYKEMQELIQNERIQRELKKDEVRQRVLRAKTESERIRATNRLQLKKKSVDINPQARPKPASESARDKKDARIKEMGLELVQRFIGRKKPAAGSKPVFKNEQIRALISGAQHKSKSPEPIQEKPLIDKRNDPGERKRRRDLVEEQKKGFKAQEIKARLERQTQADQLRERLTQVKEIQRRLMEGPTTSKRLKKKSRKHRKKAKKLEGTSDIMHINRWLQDEEPSRGLKSSEQSPVPMKVPSRSGSGKPVKGHHKSKKPSQRAVTARQGNEKTKRAESDSETVKPEGEQKQNFKKLQREAVARKAERIREQQAQRLSSNPLSLSNTHGMLMMPFIPRANPRGLSTSSYAAMVTQPVALHVGDVTAPVGSHLPEEEKHRFRDRMHEFQSRVLRYDYNSRRRDDHEVIPEEDKKQIPEEDKSTPLPLSIVESSTANRLQKSQDEEEEKAPPSQPAATSGVPVVSQPAQGLTPIEAVTHGKDGLSKELEKIDVQFDMHAEAVSERKDPDEISVERKQLGKISAAKEAEDYGQILQSMEDMERDPLTIPARDSNLQPKETGGEKAATANAAANVVSPIAKGPEEKKTEQQIKDFNSEDEEENGKEEAEPVIVYAAKDKDATAHVDEKRLRALEEETKQINEQLKRELAEKDNLILAQALRETKLQKEYQELIATQTKEFMQKMVEIAHSMQSAHNEEMNSTIVKLCEHIERLAQRTAPAAEERRPESEGRMMVTRSVEQSPAPKTGTEERLSEREKCASMRLESAGLSPEGKAESVAEEARQPEQKQKLSSPESRPQPIVQVEGSDMTELTYRKVREALGSSRSLQEEEARIQRTRREKLQELARLSPRSREAGTRAADDWYREQKKALDARKKLSLAEALKQTAAALMAEEGRVDEPEPEPKRVEEEVTDKAAPAAEVVGAEEEGKEVAEEKAPIEPKQPEEGKAEGEMRMQEKVVVPIAEPIQEEKKEEEKPVPSEGVPKESPAVQPLPESKVDTAPEHEEEEEVKKPHIAYSPVTSEVVLGQPETVPEISATDQPRPQVITLPEEEVRRESPRERLPDAVAMIVQEIGGGTGEEASSSRNLERAIAQEGFSADTEPRQGSDIEWTTHLVEPTEETPEEKAIIPAVPETEKKDDSPMGNISPIRAPLETEQNFEAAVPDSAEPAAVSKPTLGKRDDEPEELSAEPEVIDPKTAKANCIADAIFEEVIRSMVGENMFPGRPEKPLPDEVLMPNKARPRPPSGIRTALWNVEAYVDAIFKEIMDDPERFIASLSIPLNRDPIFILGQIQNEDNDYFETIEQIMTQPVLPVELYLGLEHSRKVDAVEETPEDPHHEALLTEWSNIHNKCIFDAINDALDYYRPYGLKGPPLPWSKQVRELTYRNGSVASTQDVLLGVKAKVLSWAMTNSGALQLPEDSDLAAILAQLGLGKATEGKSKLDQYRDERLETVLSTEVNLCVCDSSE